MYVQTDATACFDPNNMPDAANLHQSTTDHNHNHNHNHISADNTPPFTPIDHINHHHHHNNNNNQQDLDSSMGLEFTNPNHDPNTWGQTNMTHEMGFQHFDENMHTSTTDLLTLLHLPRCSFASSSAALLPSSSPPPPPSSGLAFLGEINPAAMMHQDNASGSGSSTLSYDPAAAAGLSYDPLFHLNLPPQPSHLLRDLMFQSLPHGYGNGVQARGNGNGNGNGNASSSSLFGGMDDGEGNTSMNGISGIYQDGDHLIHPNGGVFEFTRGDDGKMDKSPKNYVTERQRRQNFNDKYQTLRSLVPTPTKNDRASIVFDAIHYIEELKRTVGELKLLVEKKRISKERVKRLKTEDSAPAANGADHQAPGVDGPAAVVKPDPDEAFNGSAASQLRSSWLQRKCKDTEVDVRIVDDEVTIKLVQRKKINCLLSVSRTLDELQLDLRHVAGGHVGDYYSYLFNSKIFEGSSVYASAIADKLIEVVERQYAAASVAIAPTNSF